MFDGRHDVPYVETDPAHPLSVYGETKRASEAVVEQGFTAVRTAWLAGRLGANTVKTMLRLAANPDQAIAFVNDQTGSPTVAEDLAPVLVRLSAERRPGYSVLDNAGLRRDGIPPLPHWRDAFRRLVEDLIESGGYLR